MEKKYILAIDQGTTSSRAVLIDRNGKWIGSESKEFSQIYPKPGWVEHNPEEIWETVAYTIKQVIDKNRVDPKEIQCIGITNQRETIVAWDSRSGKPIYNAIVWQCRRTTSFCEKLKLDKKTSSIIKNKTGLVIDPYFSATKINWILKSVPEAKVLLKQKSLKIGTIDSYLLWKLTAGEVHATDVSNASRTMLMELKSLNWDQELLRIFKVPKDILPTIKESSFKFGQTKELDFLPDGIEISGMIGDQQSALLGQMSFLPGNVKCTYGTGSFILMNVGDKPIKSKYGMLTTVAWSIGGKTAYAIEGGAYVCGAAVQWLRDGLGIINSSDEVEVLARKVNNSGGVEFVPALTGLGAPYWNPEARGLITGITRGTNRNHIIRATLDAMALQNVDIVQAMEKDFGKNISGFYVDGGASKNNLLMQLQADYLGKKVVRPKVIETTAYGAAILAGMGSGVWKNKSELLKLKSIDQVFTPVYSRSQRLDRMNSWSKAIDKCKIRT